MHEGESERAEQAEAELLLLLTLLLLCLLLSVLLPHNVGTVPLLRIMSRIMSRRG
jgi:hypothetical protein